MAYRPADEACPKRQSMCKALLDADDNGLHIIALEMKYVFLSDVKEAAHDGTISNVFLWNKMRRLAEEWPAAMQVVEGINSMIQHEAEFAPHADLALIDARVAMRKEFGKGSRADRLVKWRDIKHQVDAIIRDAVSHSALEN
eukprot:9486908-Pyramimonas_sp.AAC.1